MWSLLVGATLGALESHPRLPSPGGYRFPCQASTRLPGMCGPGGFDVYVCMERGCHAQRVYNVWMEHAHGSLPHAACCKGDGDINIVLIKSLTPGPTLASLASLRPTPLNWNWGSVPAVRSAGPSLSCAVCRTVLRSMVQGVAHLPAPGSSPAPDPTLPLLPNTREVGRCDPPIRLVLRS